MIAGRGTPNCEKELLMTMPPEMPQYVAPSIEYTSRTLVDADNEHLKILSICWYVMAGFTVFTSLFPFFYLAMGIAMLNGAFPAGPGAAPLASTRMIGIMFITIAGLFILALWSLAALSIVTGLSLARRKRLILCYVTAGITCLQIPFGTVLGVFTFIVLARSTVRNQFMQSLTR
jgi:hypothetical protein